MRADVVRETVLVANGLGHASDLRTRLEDDDRDPTTAQLASSHQSRDPRADDRDRRATRCSPEVIIRSPLSTPGVTLRVALVKPALTRGSLRRTPGRRPRPAAVDRRCAQPVPHVAANRCTSRKSARLNSSAVYSAFRKLDQLRQLVRDTLLDDAKPTQHRVHEIGLGGVRSSPDSGIEQIRPDRLTAEEIAPVEHAACRVRLTTDAVPLIQIGAMRRAEEQVLGVVRQRR